MAEKGKVTKLPGGLQGLTSETKGTSAPVTQGLDHGQQVCDMHCSHGGPCPALTCVSWNRELLPTTTAPALPSNPIISGMRWVR